MTQLWVEIHGYRLYLKEKEELLNGEMHINAVQAILKSQFPSVNGLNSTLFQYQHASIIECGLQIVHCRSNHWILVSNDRNGETKIFDSLYPDIDQETRTAVQVLFNCTQLQMMPF